MVRKKITLPQLNAWLGGVDGECNKQKEACNYDDVQRL